MDAPKCKICGNRHYGICRTEKGEKSDALPKPMDTRKVAQRQRAKEVPTQESAPMRPLQTDDKANEVKTPKYDRNAAHREYMRGYMAKKRAADKAKQKGK